MKRICLILMLTVILITGCGRADKSNSSADSQAASAQAEADSASESKKTDDNTQEAEVIEADKEKSPLQGKIIVVDAGHGIAPYGRQEAIAPNSSEVKPAFVSGTSGKNQTEEQLNLSVALKLKAVLEEKGATVHMTRDTHETTRSNIDRAELGNETNADISVKLHADGSTDSSIHGVSVLVPGTQYISDVNITDKSRQAGDLVLESIVKQTGAVNRGISVRNDMTGFNWSKIPVILIEMGFMTNPDEDALMETDDYQNKIVRGIVYGIEQYFEEN